jgi:hypothetical protein
VGPSIQQLKEEEGRLRMERKIKGMAALGLLLPVSTALGALL